MGYWRWVGKVQFKVASFKALHLEITAGCLTSQNSWFQIWENLELLHTSTNIIIQERCCPLLKGEPCFVFIINASHDWTIQWRLSTYGTLHEKLRMYFFFFSFFGSIGIIEINCKRVSKDLNSYENFMNTWTKYLNNRWIFIVSSYIPLESFWPTLL